MKIFTGKVISKKMLKTATVAVDRVFKHPVYGKRVRKTKKYQVHDEKSVEVGQVVKFVASRPYSKTKKWKIVEVLDDKVKKALKSDKTEEKVSKRRKK